MNAYLYKNIFHGSIAFQAILAAFGKEHLLGDHEAIEKPCGLCGRGSDCLGVAWEMSLLQCILSWLSRLSAYGLQQFSAIVP